jgi:hypothetical protein
MSITNNEILMGARSCLLALLFGMFLTAKTEAQVLTNRTPDTAKVYPVPTAQQSPSPSTEPTLTPDPLLFRPDKNSKPLHESPSDPAYYVYIRGASRVIVSDVRGRTDDLFEARFEQKISSATYHLVGPDSVYVIVPVDETYSIIFESDQPVMYLETVKGRGNASPDEAIRYRDLMLGRRRAKLEITPQGVKPLRLDTNYDGQFQTLVKATVILRGLSARDTKAPEFGFQVVDRDAVSVLISIEAKDHDTGVKSLFYSFDGRHAFPYRGPVRIDLKKTSFIWAFAEDYAGNRSGFKYEF